MENKSSNNLLKESIEDIIEIIKDTKFKSYESPIQLGSLFIPLKFKMNFFGVSIIQLQSLSHSLTYLKESEQNIDIANGIMDEIKCSYDNRDKISQLLDEKSKDIYHIVATIPFSKIKKISLSLSGNILILEINDFKFIETR